MAKTQLPATQIKDNDIKNVDIAADAAIAFSKLAGVAASSHVHAAADITTGEFAATLVRRIKVSDTRAIDDAPNAFNNEVLFDFKTRTTFTPDPPGNDTFVGVMTFAPWNGTTGGPNYQLVFSNTSNVPVLAVRTGDHGASGSDWGNWVELATLDTNWAAGDITSGTLADARIAQSNVTQHVAAIDHDALLNFVADEHINWKAATANFSTTGTGHFAGNVGIGTDDPGFLLDVRGTGFVASFGVTKTFEIYADFSGVGEINAGAFMQTGGGDMVFAPDPTVGASTMIAYKEGSNWRSALEIAHTASGFGDLLLMKSGGNVGIGVATPSVTLDVDGDINVSSGSAYKIDGVDIFDGIQSISGKWTFDLLEADNGYAIHRLPTGNGATNHVRWYLIATLPTTSYRELSFQLLCANSLGSVTGSQTTDFQITTWLTNTPVISFSERKSGGGINTPHQILVTDEVDGTIKVYAKVARYGDASIIVKTFTSLSAKQYITPTEEYQGSAIPAAIASSVIFDTLVDPSDMILGIGTLLTDVISETTSATGVTIDGLLIKDGAVSASGVPDGSDATAIHDNVGGEIFAIVNKTSPEPADVFLIEDDGDAYDKKRVTFAQVEATLNHDSLTGFVMEEHIRWDQSQSGMIFVHTDNYTEGGAGTDTTAIHDNVAGEINAITEKTAQVGADMLLIEDSLAANVKKKLKLDNLLNANANTWPTEFGASKTTIADIDIIMFEDNDGQNGAKASISFDNFESTLSHDALAQFVADEHINWKNTQGGMNLIHNDNINGATESFSILDGNRTLNHDFVFTHGVLTSYGTSAS